MEYKQLKLAIFIVWIVLSGIILFILFITFLIPTDSINVIVPRCELKEKYNKRCPLCGMTTCFVNISKGKFEGAHMANKFGICLFSLFVTNEIVMMSVLFAKMKEKYL